MKLDAGWKTFGPVYEHPKGYKVHAIGLMTVGSDMIWLNAYPLSERLNQSLEVFGGNRRRGLMALAQQMYQTAIPNA